MGTPQQELQQLFALLATPTQARLRVRSLVQGDLTLIAVNPADGSQTALTLRSDEVTDLLAFAQASHWSNSSTLTNAVARRLLLVVEGDPEAPTAVAPPIAEPCGGIRTLPYFATLELNFDPELIPDCSVSLQGNLTLVTRNLHANCSMSLRIIADGSTRTLVFPSGWRFLGAAAPASIAANKVALLSIKSYGTTDADVLVAYSAEV